MNVNLVFMIATPMRYVLILMELLIVLARLGMQDIQPMEPVLVSKT